MNKEQEHNDIYTLLMQNFNHDPHKMFEQQTDAVIKHYHEQIKKLEDDIETLRKLLWLNHGHRGQYGDDGEMQCAECFSEKGFFDYKRTPVEDIWKGYESEITKKIREALKEE